MHPEVPRDGNGLRGGNLLGVLVRLFRSVFTVK